MSAAGQLPAEGPPPASAASRAPRSLDLKIVAGLFALALAARLAAAVVMPQRANDAERYVAQAGNLLDHRAFSSARPRPRWPSCWRRAW